MSKHTPGPWAVSSRIAIVGDLYSKEGQHALYCANVTRETGGLSVCGIQSSDHCGDIAITRDEAAANARLIAAAPEMCEELVTVKQIISLINTEQRDLTLYDAQNIRELIPRINAILAKIEGDK